MFVKLIESSGLMTLPLLSMIFFMLMFAVVVTRAVLRKRVHYDQCAALPLDEAPGREGR